MPAILRDRGSVKTLSQWQVRQQIYTGSVDRWRHYKPWLGPLIEALGDCVQDAVNPGKNFQNSNT
jgi:hypothetical protein